MEMDETSLEKVGPMMEPLVMVEKEDETPLELMKEVGPMAKVVDTKMEPLTMVETTLKTLMKVDEPMAKVVATKMEPLMMVETTLKMEEPPKR